MIFPQFLFMLFEKIIVKTVLLPNLVKTRNNHWTAASPFLIVEIKRLRTSNYQQTKSLCIPFRGNSVNILLITSL